MDFGWLISLKTNFSCWNKYPIMYKWIITDIGMKCIIIINNLYSHKNPTDILRIAWAITNELNKLLQKTKIEDSDINLLKERDYEVIQQIKIMQKRMGELKRSITGITQIIRDTDNDLVKVLSLLTNEVVKEEYSKYDKIKEWWYKNIEYDETNKEQILLSTDVWNKFKKENKNYINENSIVVDDIKKFIKTYIENDKYNEKSKNGAIELLGFKFVSIEENIKIKLEEKIKKVEKQNEVELEIKEELNKVKKKKTKIDKIIIKTKDDEPTITNEIEENVLHEYNEKEMNVLDISKNNNILTWQVISILVNNQIISVRNEARGYDLYIQTDEYKNKRNKNKTAL
jgi:hypothetical protein